MSKKIKYSVFTPVYNEEGNVIPLFEEVKEVMNKIGEPWEFIFVNDGSRDKTLEECLSIKDPHVRVIALRRNHGQSVAMDAGFRACRGEIVISMDGDRQNDPRDIPKMIEMLYKDNLDVVAGWRKKRKDPLWMRFVTTVARGLRGIFADDGVHDSGCTLRVYRYNYVHDLELWGEMHRYIMALLKWRGARIGELQVNHRARVMGVTKYKFNKSAKGFVDLLYIWFWKKFSHRPLHLFGIGGLGVVGLGILAGIWTIIQKVVFDASLSDSSWLVLSFFLILIGMQFFFTGVLLDILIRNYYNGSVEKRYVKREVTEISRKNKR